MAVSKCVKYLVFLFNLLFWISGCIILGVSIYLKVSKNGNVIMVEAVLFVDLLIGVGVIIMVLGFLGCCGAIKEIRCMLILFFVGLLLIFIAGILGSVREKKSQEWVKESLGKLIPLKDQKPEVQTDMQKLEKEPCVKFVTSFMEKHAIIAPGIAFGIAVLMLFGMAFAMTLFCQLGKRDTNTA